MSEDDIKEMKEKINDIDIRTVKMLSYLPGEQPLQTKHDCASHRNVMYWILGGVGVALIAIMGFILNGGVQ